MFAGSVSDDFSFNTSGLSNSDLLQVLAPLGGFGCLHWFEQCLPLGIVKKPLVSFITPTWAEPFRFTPTSMMSISHTNMTWPMTFHNIPAGLPIFVFCFVLFCFVCVFVFVLFFCLFFFFNSGHEASAFDPERHKQF